jgi:hypothetical protein
MRLCLVAVECAAHDRFDPLAALFAGGGSGVVTFSVVNPIPATIESAIAIGETREASHDIGNIVMCAGSMIDRVATTARGAAFKPSQLVEKLGMVEQCDPVRIDQRQQVDVKRLFGFALGS